MNNKKVAILLADGFEEIEAISVVDILRRAGVTCDMVSLGGESVNGSHKITVHPDFQFDHATWPDYDMLILPGGLPGADTLRDDPRVIALVKDFAKTPGKYLAAICAAPQVLAKADVVRGKKVTSYPATPYQEALESAGAEYLDNPKVVIDENLITSRGPATAPDFAFAVLAALGSDLTSLKSGMLY